MVEQNIPPYRLKSLWEVYVHIRTSVKKKNCFMFGRWLYPKPAYSSRSANVDSHWAWHLTVPTEPLAVHLIIIFHIVDWVFPFMLFTFCLSKQSPFETLWLVSLTTDSLYIYCLFTQSVPLFWFQRRIFFRIIFHFKWYEEQPRQAPLGERGCCQKALAWP